MDAVTYPKQNVIDELDKHTVPVRIAFDNPFADAYRVKWTPNLVFLDQDKQVHHRIIGFLPAEELIPAILLGAGKTYLEIDGLNRAMGLLEECFEKHPQSFAAPQAVYFHGVCRYKQTHDGDPLKKAEEKLQAKYPDSEWTQRAAPYKLL